MTFRKKFKKNRNNHKDSSPINSRIRASKVLCIDQDNENRGVISTSEALDMAHSQGLDLVQVSPPSKSNKYPTCKIIDYNKFRYEQSKKEKLQAKKRREAIVKTKEVRLRPGTDTNDLAIKASQASKFLEEGHRVRVLLRFRGREMTHRDVGFDKLDDFFELLGEYELINEPTMNGMLISALVGAKKKSTEECKVA